MLQELLLNMEVWLKIIMGVAGSLVSAFVGTLIFFGKGWLTSYTSNLISTIKDTENRILHEVGAVKSEILEMKEDIDEVKHTQVRQEIGQAEAKKDISKLIEMSKRTERELEQVTSKVQQMEVEQAKLSQWKYDKEHGL